MPRKDLEPKVLKGLPDILFQGRIEGRHTIPDLVGMKIVMQVKPPKQKA